MVQSRTKPIAADGESGRHRSARKVLIAGGIGGFVEYFDFAAYGFLATTIAKHFFPSTNPTVALLQTFAVFAVAFAMRPLGGMVFGHFGDKIGRTNTTAVAVVMMSAATFAVGLLPGYATLGIGAPLLLIACRMFQGFSAGGEYNGATVLISEFAPSHRRALYASAVPTASLMGQVTSALTVVLLSANLSPAAFDAWGWRVPFLLAGPLGLIGLYMRLRLDESPAFDEAKRTATIVRAPVLRTFRQYYREILTIFGFAISAAVCTYLLLVFAVNYLISTLKFEHTEALLANAVAILAYCLLCPVAGLISDRVGRRPVLIVSCAALAVLSVPSMLIITQGGVVAAVLGMCLLTPMLAAITVVQAAVTVESFPTMVRYSGGISNNLAATFFGGTAPFVATFLVSATGSPLAPGFYLAAISLVSLMVVIFALRETFQVALVPDQDLQGEQHQSRMSTEIIPAVS